MSTVQNAVVLYSVEENESEEQRGIITNSSPLESSSFIRRYVESSASPYQSYLSLVQISGDDEGSYHDTKTQYE